MIRDIDTKPAGKHPAQPKMALACRFVIFPIISKIFKVFWGGNAIENERWNVDHYDMAMPFSTAASPADDITRLSIALPYTNMASIALHYTNRDASN